MCRRGKAWRGVEGRVGRRGMREDVLEACVF